MEIPKQYNAIKHLLGVSTPNLRANNSFIVSPPIPESHDPCNMVRQNSRRLTKIASSHGMVRSASDLSSHRMGPSASFASARVPNSSQV
eukprot:c27367_g1_i1 orf=3-269(+)